MGPKKWKENFHELRDAFVSGVPIREHREEAHGS